VRPSEKQDITRKLEAIRSARFNVRGRNTSRSTVTDYRPFKGAEFALLDEHRVWCFNSDRFLWSLEHLCTLNIRLRANLISHGEMSQLEAIKRVEIELRPRCEMCA